MPEVSWKPQPGPQRALLTCPVEDILFGGQRGGGKTDGLLGDWAAHAAEHGKHARGLFIRKTYPKLMAAVDRSIEIYSPIGWKWLGSGSSGRSWTSEKNAKLFFRHLQHDKDVTNFQGHSYTWIGVDEAGEFADVRTLNQLRATLRSSAGVPCLFRLTANPGGVGHNWLRSAYIDPAPPLTAHRAKLGTTTVLRVYIPSRLEDNPALTDKDPNYWSRVEAAAGHNQALLRAWRYGDWNIVSGGALDDVWQQPIHVVPPFEIPFSWAIDRSFDWGSSKPFSVGWWAESDGTGTSPKYPRGTLFRIAEWYGCIQDHPNEGIKMLSADVAAGIQKFENGSAMLRGRVRPGPADASIWDARDGVSIYDSMRKAGCKWVPSDNRAGSRAAGLERLRAALVASERREGAGFYVFDTCRDWLRTVPVLPRDAKNPDDVDTNAEDHGYDETRYRIMAQRIRLERRELLGT